MIGDFLITKQTGAEGRICNSVMITERKYTRKEYYLAFMNDRKFNGPCLIASAEGGVNIEEIAEKNPDAILTFPIGNSMILVYIIQLFVYILPLIFYRHSRRSGYGQSLEHRRPIRNPKRESK